MTSKRTLIQSVITQGTGAALNLVTLPLVARHLGSEAFGIVGLALTIQAWIMALDGCNLMTRFSADGQRHGVGSPGRQATAQIFAAGERLYGALALVVVLLAAALVAADLPQERLQAQSLDPETVSTSVLLIAACAVTKLAASFYRGANIGMSDMDFTNAVSALCYVVRFLAAYLAVLVWPHVAVFLTLQLASYVIEAALMRHRFVTRHVAKHEVAGFRQGLNQMRPSRELIESTMFVAALLMAASQLDKAVLVTVLPLREYGAASIAIVLCAGVFVATTPVMQIFLPGLVDMAKQGTLADSGHYFRMMTVMAMLALVFALVATGASAPLAALLSPRDSADADVVRRAFIYYGIGNGLGVLCQGLYWFHFAAGSIASYRRLALIHLGGYFTLLLVLSHAYGLDGAGSAWMIGNAALLVLLLLDLSLNRSRCKAIPWLVCAAIATFAIGWLVLAILSAWWRADPNADPWPRLLLSAALAAVVSLVYAAGILRLLAPRLSLTEAIRT